MSSASFDLRPGRPRRRFRLFRTARLNGVGWLALLGASLVAAAIGAALAALLGRPWWVGALVGLPVVVLVLVVVDGRRSRRAMTSWSWTDDLGEVETAALVLRQQGIEVSVSAEPPALVFPAHAQKRVAAVLHLPLPPQP